jgi:alanyl aminopeptidase
LRAWLAALVATGGRDTGLRKQLADTARKSLADPAAVDPEFRSLAWAVGVQELGDSFARQLESALLASQDALLRSDAAWAIGSAETPQGSSRALALAARPDVRQAELGRLLYPQFGSPLTRDAAWTWLQDNFDHVLAKAPGIFKARYFQLLEPFCDAPNREQIASRLQDEVRKLGAGELEMQRTLEGIDLCIAQRAALGPSVSAALEAR